MNYAPGRVTLWLTLLSVVLLNACVSRNHGDPIPEAGQGGYAEWRWPYLVSGESWADQVPHPDKVPTIFRTAQVRLQQMRQGCAWLLFPAFVKVAETQYNQALRAFASELYDDAFADLRALHNQLDEIDRRILVAGANGACNLRRNRHCHGETHGPCGAAGCDNACGQGPAADTCPHCGHGGAEFNCSSSTGLLKKPGCGQQKTACHGADRCPAPVKGTATTAPPATARPAAPASGGTLLNNIYLKTQFDYNSDQVRPEYRAYLNDLAQELRQSDYPRLRIEGHASAEGSETHNQALSSRRAESVRQILIQQGVPAERLFITSFGEHRPSASNSTEEGRISNRRVELYLLDGPLRAGAERAD